MFNLINKGGAAGNFLKDKQFRNISKDRNSKENLTKASSQNTLKAYKDVGPTFTPRDASKYT